MTFLCHVHVFISSAKGEKIKLTESRWIQANTLHFTRADGHRLQHVLCTFFFFLLTIQQLVALFFFGGGGYTSLKFCFVGVFAFAAVAAAVLLLCNYHHHCKTNNRKSLII